jgi:heat-inducible transcriptional repressor
MNNLELSEREKSILRYVVHQYILTANPVGSRNISKKYDVGFSPATIRNVMADLEDSGLLGHPHTSAGRVPTDQGYRFYVDSLMGVPKLPITEKRAAESAISASNNNIDDIIKATSNILSNITNQLACITYPQLSDSTLEKIQIVKLSTTKILVVVTVVSGLVKTITLELRSNFGQSDLTTIQSVLNQRLAGLKFSEIRETIAERFQNIYATQYKPIIRVFLDSVDRIFNDKSDNKSVVAGTKNILTQPEFEELDKFQGIIELVEDRDIIVHLMNETSLKDSKSVNVKIGAENLEEKFTNYSLVTTKYNVGNALGSVGIVGPKRMEYSKVIATVEYIASLLTKNLN